MHGLQDNHTMIALFNCRLDVNQIFTSIDILSFPSLHGLRRTPKKSTKPKHKNVQKLRNHNNACVVIRRYVGEERSKA